MSTDHKDPSDHGEHGSRGAVPKMVPVLIDSDGGTQQQKQAPGSPVDLQKYFGIVISRFPLLLFVILVFLAYGAYAVKKTDPVYSSRAEIKVEPSKARVFDFTSQSAVVYQPFELNTATRLIKSPFIASRVLQSLDEKHPAKASQAVQEEDPSPIVQILQTVNSVRERLREALTSYEPPVVTDEMREQERVHGLMRSISVQLQQDTKIISISAEANDAFFAQAIAQEFAKEYKQFVQDDQRSSIEEQNLFIEDQISTTEEELLKLEDELLRFRDNPENRVTLETRDIAAANLEKLSQDILQTQSELADLKARQANLSEASIKLQLYDDSPIYQTLTKRYNELLLEKVGVNSISPDGSVLRIDNEREFTEVERQIKEAEKQYEEGLLDSITLLEARLTSRQDSYKNELAKIDKIDTDLISYRQIERKIDSNRDIVKALISKLDQLEVSEDVNQGSVEIISPATVSRLPSKPNVLKSMLFFTLLGSFFGVMLILGLHFLDRSVRDPLMVEEELGLANLGHVPYVKPIAMRTTNRGKRKSVVPLLNPSASEPSNENFRYLRTSLNFSRAHESPKVILVTSCFPQEGKSTISANLSISFTENNLRVLLIDADLKRPSLQVPFEVSRTPGLSDLLAGQKKREECIVKTRFENLDMLPAGTITPNPVSLLESKDMKELVEQMRKEYDIVIIDSAPAHGMADTMVISRMVDGVIAVVRQGKTPMEVLRRVTEKLQSSRATILGIVYNNTTKRRRDGVSSYGYGYGYGYGYAYRYEAAPDDDDST